MSPGNAFEDYLKRLPRRSYQHQSYVHWTLCVEDRKTGWLKGNFYYRFRELLTHTMFRYGICCPIYCCMPDHIHLMWLGVLDDSDQLNAMKHFRKNLNDTLCVIGFQLQGQGYDHVLKDEERVESSFIDICDYIARNPERSELVPIDGYHTYSYTGCLIPGYPELKPFAADYWRRFWRTYSYLRKNGFVRLYPPA